MAPIAINLGGSEEQKNNYLPKIASNELRFGIGMSEFVGAREDAGIEFSKNKLNGRALFVLDAENSDFIILANKSRNIFLINAKDKGVKINKLTTVDKTRSFHEILLENVNAEILALTEDNNRNCKKSY